MRIYNKIALCCIAMLILGGTQICTAESLYSLKNIINNNSMIYERRFNERDFSEYAGKTGAVSAAETANEASVEKGNLRLVAVKDGFVRVSEKIVLPKRYVLNFKCKCSKGTAYIGIYDGEYRLSLSMNERFLSVAGEAVYTKLWERFEQYSLKRNAWYEFAVEVDNGTARIYRKGETDLRYKEIMSDIKLCRADGGTIDISMTGAEAVSDLCVDFVRVYAYKDLYTMDNIRAYSDGKNLNYELDIGYTEDGINNCKVFILEIDMLDENGNSLRKTKRLSSLWENTSSKICGFINSPEARKAKSVCFTLVSDNTAYASNVINVDWEES